MLIDGIGGDSSATKVAFQVSALPRALKTYGRAGSAGGADSLPAVTTARPARDVLQLRADGECGEARDAAVGDHARHLGVARDPNHFDATA
eukprot:CAMPEP_0113841516 /NCGR_PEP_ID=MMETSP0328-20130328/12201_1 /TAXON_ID=39455 /ORGANISM="Alexandrium minutum" /LENGTH=90 /DNA_ID=CAMNT_0000810295 /DNA_START=164 /DNA_END=434 /DNA_ORIENTATION=+ /assembly_acc=CAM_ASM_000350